MQFGRCAARYSVTAAISWISVHRQRIRLLYLCMLSPVLSAVIVVLSSAVKQPDVLFHFSQVLFMSNHEDYFFQKLEVFFFSFFTGADILSDRCWLCVAGNPSRY